VRKKKSEKSTKNNVTTQIYIIRNVIVATCTRIGVVTCARFGIGFGMGVIIIEELGMIDYELYLFLLL
jgi:DNA-binding winged helix-turn-helix (wHTH) protein